MTDGALFAGPAIRRLRKKEGLTQAAMATRLSISASYLNLIERNQRPLSARVVFQVVDQFDFDPRRLREHESIGGVDGLARRFADERFSDFEIDRDEIAEFLAAAPQAAAAFARLYDSAGAGAAVGEDPIAQARFEIERWRNHYADLDMLAEKLADEVRLSHSDPGVGLAERLREKHQLAIRILPREIMPDAIRRLDLHARQLQLSEMLTPASRNFQIASQIGQLEYQKEISSVAAGAQFSDEAARKLFERHLVGYFAAALLMPYSRFLRACEATNYDLPILRRRFGVSFEQLGHRLTTLQRVGQRGLPFFMARLDRAGQFSKRFAGASAATLLESEMSCPLWVANHAFERPGHLCVQAVVAQGVDAGPDHWFTISRTVEGSGASGEARFVLVLGLEAKLAADLAQARGVNLAVEDADPIGLGCARCHRPGCTQRSLPPRGAQLSFDNIVRGVTPFQFGRD
ncbi:short-chain fatty acyl-CoA regulator family protein [Pontixanthobacter aestiaquae]|uniref:ImmA/IrrE family metallo-endopeptidase n=1 Tax=Pontixanthobacter aestiaquae TaxID=1509367 RepID=A0A844ZC84_9SPHN|nr:short-chain fatty acyl-CoA regulator family protein [Pontixanthobacter aestiaquae]MDN3645563.1 short-chain fatty acyl-CoA regulator family protein [Pontixanthobacter aestiaquae]MXO83439.1 ImmA/IrrE family metallo-endopeptidase [Pontixanthobacter aestiaquae]